jgi:hypothetical protein
LIQDTGEVQINLPIYWFVSKKKLAKEELEKTILIVLITILNILYVRKVMEEIYANNVSI